MAWFIKGREVLPTLAALFLFSACNFHEVDRGKLYRSAQLTGDELAQAIDRVGIRTVINLRGASPSREWYQEEKRVTQEKGVRLIDIPMSAGRLPHRKGLIALLDAFRDAERPILIHCKAGADRTGEAAAIYQMLYMGKSREEALKMLTLKYHHSAKHKPAKRYFIREVWQGEEWARSSYDPCRGEYSYYDLAFEECR